MEKTMKIIKILLSLIVAMVAGVYVILFTGFGNSLLKSVIEAKVKETSGLDIVLERFSLSMSELDLVVRVTSHNVANVKGNYSLFSQRFDIDYDISFLALNELEDIVKRKLNGEFKTNGNVKGDLEFLKISGSSDVAESATAYEVELTQLNPTSIKADLKHLDIATLLWMVGEKKYADAKLYVDLDFADITPHKYDGTIRLKTLKGLFSKEVLRKDFGINIPKTTFATNLDAKLKGDDIDYGFVFDSNLAKIDSKGKIAPETLTMDLIYSASIKELALLKPITGADVRSKVNLGGTVKGSKEKLNVILKSDIAGSKTEIKAVLNEFQPSSLKADIAHLKLQKLFYMLKQPHYTDGVFNLKADLTSLQADNLKGKITTKTTGKLDNVYLSKAYEFKHPMPKTTYTLESSTLLEEQTARTKVKLRSTLANLDVKEARFDLKKGSFESDYSVAIASLEKLYFVTDRHLRGGIEANGKITKDQKLIFTAHSNIAQGKLDIKLVENDLHLDLNDMRTKKLLWILKYPEIFDGGINAGVDYNLATQKGDVVAKFDKGVFVKNQAFDLLKQYGKINLYKERFDGNAKAKINKEKIAATFDLKSRKARIYSKSTKLDTKKSRIDSKITIVAKNAPISVTLSGDIAKPKVGVDLKEFMKSEAGKKLEEKATKEVEKLFKKLF